MDKNKIILCIDDEVFIVKSLERCLRLANYDVLKANSGVDGLRILQECQGKVDLIIIDQRMPQMTGGEFLSRAKESYGHIASIMLSGHADLGSLDKALNEGDIYKFVTKPWDNDELIATIKAALNSGGKN